MYEEDVKIGILFNSKKFIFAEFKSSTHMSALSVTTYYTYSIMQDNKVNNLTYQVSNPVRILRLIDIQTAKTFT